MSGRKEVSTADEVMAAKLTSTFTLITGANSGIGLELARQAAADDRNLILVARNASTLETAANEFRQRVTVHTIAEDLSEPGAAEKVYDRVRVLGAEVDCLINDAGFADHGAFATVDLAKQARAHHRRQHYWYADVPNKRCVRVREGGEVLQTIHFERGCFACALGGADRRTLFVVAAEWRGIENMADVIGQRTGQVIAVEVPVPGGGWP